MRKPKNAVKNQPRTVLCSTLFSPVFSMYGQANGAEEVRPCYIVHYCTFIIKCVVQNVAFKPLGVDEHKLLYQL